MDDTAKLPPCGDDLCAPGCTVCAPGGPLDTVKSETVTITGRAFRVGASYRGKRGENVRTFLGKHE